MNSPKRHHFIPVMLSKRFTDHNGRLYFFDKRFADKGVQRSTPRNLFVERYLYSQTDQDQNRDATVEGFLAQLEGKVAPIIEKIVNAARTGMLATLTSTEKNCWDLNLYIQWKRVPDVHERIQGEIIPPGLSLQDRLRDLPVTHDAFAKLNDHSEMERIQKNAWVESVTDPGINVLPTLDKKALGVVVIQNSEYGFVIGSNPVLKLTYPGRPHLSDPTVEMWLPLAHDVVVSPCPGEEDKLVTVENEHVRAINEGIFNQSRIVAGSSHQLIASLIGADGL